MLKPTLQHKRVDKNKKWYSFKKWIEVWRDVVNSQNLWRRWKSFQKSCNGKKIIWSFTTKSVWQMWRVFRKQSDTCFMILAVALQSIDMNIKLIVQRIGGKIKYTEENQDIMRNTFYFFKMKKIKVCNFPNRNIIMFNWLL